jgi:pyrroloquinoline quinone (PQQ) biosynthesis protein C
VAQQPPLTPEQLKAPPLAGDDYMKLLRQQKAEKYPELPPIIRAMADGSLERDYLELWIKDSYYYWDNLYRAVGGVFVKINLEEVRNHLLVKLVNVEGKELAHEWNGSTTPAYEELWLRFAEGAGIPRAEMLAWKPFTRTHLAVTTLELYSKGYEWTWLDGVANTYAGDLHQRECLGQAYEALRTTYRVPENALEFFQVVLADIDNDLVWEEKYLPYLCCTTERQHTAARAFRERLDIENQAILGAWLAREADKAGGRVPTQVP